MKRIAIVLAICGLVAAWATNEAQQPPARIWALPIHNETFTGAIVGNGYRAVVVGHSSERGWVLNADGVLE